MTGSDFSEELLAGEKIVWSGKPARGFLLTRRDWALFPVSLLWGGFAVFWETMVLAQERSPLIRKLWGVPFVLVGLYLLAGRFLLDAWVRRATDYAVTNRRILIARSGIFAKFSALNLHQLPEASFTQRPDGRGTIRFGLGRWPLGRGNGFGSWTPSLEPVPQFIAVEEARRVFDLIQNAAGRPI